MPLVSKSKKTECHPSRPLYAKKMCRACYKTNWQKNNPDYREKHNRSNREYKVRNKEKVRASAAIYRRQHRLKKYGLTLKQYNLLLKRQRYKCAICETKLSNDRYCHIDHDHNTGKVRGILCLHCNVALGLLKDDIRFVEKTLKYLSKP